MWYSDLAGVIRQRPRRLAAVAVAVAAVSLAWPDKSPEAAPGAPSTATEFSAADIAVVRAASTGAGVLLTGSLSPLNQTIVNARQAGDMATVVPREGESVRKGQMLARLDTRDLEARLEQAQANFKASKLEADLYADYLARMKKLYEAKYLSEVDYATYVGNNAARQGQYEVHKAALTIAQKALKDAATIAPISGVVAERMVEPGQSVQANAPLFKLVDLSEMELAAQVQAADLARIKVGQPVQVTVEGYGQRIFAGKIVRINPVARSGTRNVAVYVSVPNHDHVLRGGLFARGVVGGSAGGGQAASAALSIPLGAVRNEKGGPAVFVVRSDKLVLQTVVLGTRDDRAGTVQVVSGLAAGERIVLTPIKASLNGGSVKLPAGA